MNKNLSVLVTTLRDQVCEFERRLSSQLIVPKSYTLQDPIGTTWILRAHRQSDRVCKVTFSVIYQNSKVPHHHPTPLSVAPLNVLLKLVPYLENLLPEPEDIDLLVTQVEGSIRVLDNLLARLSFDNGETTDDQEQNES